MAKLRINNQSFEVSQNENTPLLWFLREQLGLKGTKFGCGKGLCGACTVVVNDQAVRSCVTPVSSLIGQSVITIEGLSEQGEHPLQIAWLKYSVPQCGYCQSGQIMSAFAIYKSAIKADRNTIKNQMSGNICRCGTYVRIIDAIESVINTDKSA